MSGRVVDGKSGDPLAGARVSVEERLDNASPVEVSSSTPTAADGSFALAGLAAGLHSIVVTAADHNGRILSGLRVDDGGDLGPLTIDLSPTSDGEKPHMEMTGIGAVMSVREDKLTIMSLLPTGGGAAAGLQPGDVVLRIDGQDPVPVGFAGAMQMIRGPEGSVVILTVVRGAGAPVDVAVTRRRVKF